MPGAEEGAISSRCVDCRLRSALRVWLRVRCSVCRAAAASSADCSRCARRSEDVGIEGPGPVGGVGAARG